MMRFPLLKPIPFTLLIAVLCQYNSYAQDEERQTKLTSIQSPPNPEAASLGRYGEIPTNLYNGAINFSLPIVTMSCGEIQLPIGLDYSSNGGIKVGDVANNVGLGWTLSGGGSVSRSIVSMPDDEANGFLTTRTTMQLSDLDIKTTPQVNSYHLKQLARISNGCIDFQTDNYFFDIYNASGSFHFNWAGQVQFNNKSPIKIDYVMNNNTLPNIEQWMITDDKGTRFTFSNFDAVSKPAYQGNCSSPLNYISTWYLTKIEDYYGNTIQYEYENYSYRKNENTSKSVSIIEGVTGLCSNFGSPGAEWDINSPSGYGLQAGSSSSITQTTYYSKRISVIYSSTGSRVTFHYNTDRTDVAGLTNINNFKSLDQIKYYEDSSLVREWTLNHDYSTGRLSLKEVKESMNGLEKKHQFTYNAAIPTSVNSFAIDHWGYYNGNTSNQTLVPTFKHIVNTTTYSGAPFYQEINYSQGANREANVRGGNGLLKKIIYPTGGTTEFTYEPNSCSNVGSQTVESYAIHPTVYINHGCYAYADSTGFRQTVTEPFDLTETTMVDIYFGASIGRSFVGCAPAKKPKMILSKVENGTSTIIAQRQFNFTIPGAQDEGGYADHITLSLSAGHYVMRCEAECNYEGFDEASIDVVYSKVIDSIVTKEFVVGGARIKEIKNTDPYSNVLNTKKYFYNLANNNSLSSGVLVTRPNYKVNNNSYIMASMSGGGGNMDPMRCYSVIMKTLYLAQSGNQIEGSHIGYRDVTEEITGAGKSVYNYSTAQMYNAGVSDYEPFLPPDNAETFKMGLLLNKKNYSTTGQLVNEEKYTYDFIESVVPQKMVIFKGDQDLINEMTFPPSSLSLQHAHYTRQYNEFFEMYPYTKRSGFARLRKKESITYDANNQQINQIENIDYHPVVKQLQGKKIVTNSDARVIENQILYPIDKTNDNTFQQMVNANRINLPVENVFLEDNVILKRNFSNFTILGNKVWALSESFKVENGPVNTDVVYNKFDDKGNLLHYTASGNKQVGVLWGYSGRYPVVRIEDISASAYNAFIAANPNILSQLNAPVSDIQFYNAIQQVRSALPDAKIIAFNYRPGIGLIASLDVNNIITRYEYDALGRLTVVKDANGNILKSHQYRYQGAE